MRVLVHEDGSMTCDMNCDDCSLNNVCTSANQIEFNEESIDFIARLCNEEIEFSNVYDGLENLYPNKNVYNIINNANITYLCDGDDNIKYVGVEFALDNGYIFDALSNIPVYKQEDYYVALNDAYQMAIDKVTELDKYAQLEIQKTLDNLNVSVSAIVCDVDSCGCDECEYYDVETNDCSL